MLPQIMEKMTCGGKFNLDTVGPYKVESIRYLGEPAYDSTTDDNLPKLATSKASPMITLVFSNATAQFRASGTEPKFKFYFEMKGAPGEPREKIEADLNQMKNFLLTELVQPDKYGLIAPSKL